MIRTVEDILAMHWRAIPNIANTRWIIVADDDEGNDVALIAADMIREVAQEIIALHNSARGF